MKCNQLSALAAVVVLALGTPAAASIAIDDVLATGASGGATSSYTISSFDASSSDKLVVVVGSRRDRTSQHWITGVTYNGLSMNEAVQQRSGNGVEETTGIYYLDNPGAAGPIVVSLNAKGWSPDSGISAIGLSGTAPGVAATAGSIGASTSLNTLVDDTIVIAGSENVTGSATPVPQAPLTDLGGSNLGSGYQFVSTAGVVTPTFSSTGATTVAAAFEAAALPPAPELVGQLGILDLDANGGINPATGAPWQEGDQYRLAFVTSTTRDATSADMTDYDAFVQGAADASSLGLDDATWKALGSTVGLNSRDHTGTTDSVGGAIFLVDGTSKVADNYNDFWDGSHDAPLSTDENGNVIGGEAVWAGMWPSGAPEATRHLGSIIIDGKGGYRAHYGRATETDGRWARVYHSLTSASHRFYALSEPLTVRQAVIPEPSMLLIWSLGLLAAACFRRRHQA